MDDVTREEVVTGLEQSIRVVAKATLDLADIGTLSAEVREPMVAVAEYFISILLMIDQAAAVQVVSEISAMKTAREEQRLDTSSEN